MIGAWEFSEYMLVVSIILLTMNIGMYIYRVFICKEVLLKNVGSRFLLSLLVFAALLALLVLNIKACTAESLSLWLGFPLLIGSLLVTFLIHWSFGQQRTLEPSAVLVSTFEIEVSRP